MHKEDEYGTIMMLTKYVILIEIKGENDMKKLLSMILALSLCLCLSVPASADAKDDAAIKVTITKTDIKADSVLNEDGYGSLHINEVYADGESVKSYPQAALINRTGDFLFPYRDTWNRYHVSDGVVSLIGGAYTEYYLYVDDPEQAMIDPIGFYSPDGKELFSGDYFGAYPIYDGYAFVTEIHGTGLSDLEIISSLIDPSGQVVLNLPGGFNELAGYGGDYYNFTIGTMSMTGGYSEGMLVCCSYASQDDYYNSVADSLFYLNEKGEVALTVSAEDYTNIWGFHEGLAGVKAANGKIGYIDKTGALVIPCEYDTCGDFCDGLACTSKNGKFGYINKNNETVIPFEYDSGYGAADGLASVGIDGKYGLVDYHNNVIVPPEYDDITSFRKGVAYAVKDGVVYIIEKDDPDQPAILGDVDGDGEVTIVDATTIQRQLADIPSSSYNASVADVDEDGSVTIIDATFIQRWLAGLPSNEKIGKPIT